MVNLRALVTTLPLLTSLAHAYANPGACSGTCTNTHDPSLVRRSDGTWFRFATNGDIAVHSAPDVSGPWTYLGAALPNGPSIAISGATDIWAPDVQLIGDTYYLFYAISSFGSQNSAIGVATSTTLDIGSWTDLGSTGVTSSASVAYNAIDPNLINVGGAYYLNFGSFWNDINQVAME